LIARRLHGFHIVQLKEAKMATKKKAAKATLAKAFIFKKDYVYDEVPPWVSIDKSAWAKIQQLKTKFINDVNSQLGKGQK
jgi:hypothetical protein